MWLAVPQPPNDKNLNRYEKQNKPDDDELPHASSIDFGGSEATGTGVQRNALLERLGRTYTRLPCTTILSL